MGRWDDECKKKDPEIDLLLYQNINFGNGNETVETTSKVDKLHLCTHIK